MNEKILFVEVAEAWEREYLENKMTGIGELIFLKSAIPSAAVPLKDAAILSTFIQSKVTAQVIESAPQLKFISTRSTGFDHIDINAAKKKGVPVSNVPTYGEHTVAEHTFALILSLSRNLRRAYFKTKEENFSLDGLMGFDLKGKTIGVVGTGNIGLHVIQMARGFNMQVVAFDVKQNTFLADVLGFRYVPFEELLASSDIISLHVPYMPATHHLINSGNISKIKPGAILINTSRGGLVETEALVKALDQGILRGAGLDVLEAEHELSLDEKRLLATSRDEETWKRLQLTLKNHILLRRDNVIYTPHMAFYSKEAVIRILDTTIANIQGFLAGKPQNVVNT